MTASAKLALLKLLIARHRKARANVERMKPKGKTHESTH